MRKNNQHLFIRGILTCLCSGLMMTQAYSDSDMNAAGSGEPLTTISISSPVQENRVVVVSGAALSLEITNSGSSKINANAITVSNKASCPDLLVEDNLCTSVAPGESCTLKLTSNTPYVPCMITVSANNAANRLQTLIAFSYLGGLVFQESDGSGKIAIPLDTVPGTGSQLISIDSHFFGAYSSSDGAHNTDALISDCSDSSCAAFRCRNLNGATPDWYVPAIDELRAVHTALCSNASTPCNFGGFYGFYWSSSLLDYDNVSGLQMLFPKGFVQNTARYHMVKVICVRAFTH